VFDTMGGDVQEKSWKVLKENGILISIARQPDPETAKKYNLRYGFVFIKPDAVILHELAAMIDAGTLKPVIGNVFPLAEIKKAHDLSQSGRARGKIVIKIV
jgi:NADPH:quinone reductase-like Zn-dependent oxidoreductase